MALRIKSRWHDDDAERSLDEIAGALAFIGWRIARTRRSTCMVRTSSTRTTNSVLR